MNDNDEIPGYVKPQPTSRAISRLLLALVAAWLSFSLFACTTLHDTAHNDQGGYIDACGDLPGLVGDDC